MSGYTYETEIELMPNWKDVEEPIVINLALDIGCYRFGVHPSGFGPPEFYDPGFNPEFDLDEARIEFGADIPALKLSPSQFYAMFGDLAEKLFNSACDEAADTGEFG